MERFFSKNEPDLLSHIIFRDNEFNGRLNLVDPKEYLQVAALVLKDEEEFKAHVHIWKDLELSTSIAQEAWVVIEGKVHVQLLDPDANLIGDTILDLGDCCITLNGGHKYKSIGRSRVFEFKSGPYLGEKFDKFYVSEI